MKYRLDQFSKLDTKEVTMGERGRKPERYQRWEGQPEQRREVHRAGQHHWVGPQQRGARGRAEC